MDTLVTVPAAPGSLLVFFALAFGISWAAWAPAALASRGLLRLRINTTLTGLAGAFGPFLAALITAGLFEGRAGLAALLRGFTIWRVGLQWYLFVLLWPAALSLTRTGLHVLAGGAAPDFSETPFTKHYPVPGELAASRPWAFLPFVFLQQMVVGSSMGEEPGWRGYALPRLLSGWGVLWGSAILGVLWSVWHLPLSLTRGDSHQGSFSGWMVLGLVATSILFTWVYTNTGGSLLLALLFHTAIAVTGLFLSSSDAHPAVEPALTWAVAILALLRG